MNSQAVCHENFRRRYEKGKQQIDEHSRCDGQHGHRPPDRPHNDLHGNKDTLVKEKDGRRRRREIKRRSGEETWPGSWIIVEESQNLSPHEIKTILSRVGKESKIVLTGDIHQIDSPYLDAGSNGLSYVVERLKG